MKGKKERTPCEIVIPQGYDVTEYLDTDDTMIEEEPPVLTEEVTLRFEREQTDGE